MDKQANDIGQPFMEVVTRKFESQEKKITELDEKIKNIPDQSQDLEQVKKDLIEIKAAIKNISFPTKDMRELSVNLKTSVSLLKRPVQNEVLHQHHIPKLLWIAIGLLFLNCLFFILWLSAMKSYNRYEANDTKYRYLKLYDNNNLRQLLYITDSLYLVNPEMRDSIIKREDQIRRNLERLQKAIEMEKEARELREKAKDN